MKQPFKPYPPIEPQEYLEQRHDVSIVGDATWNIDDLTKELPDGITLKDLRFANTVSYDGGVDIWYVEKVKNPNYKSQMQQYRKLKEMFDVAWAKYEEQMKDYTVWAEAEELKVLELRLKHLKDKRKKEEEELKELTDRLAKHGARMEQLNKGAGKKKC